MFSPKPGELWKRLEVRLFSPLSSFKMLCSTILQVVPPSPNLTTPNSLSPNRCVDNRGQEVSQRHLVQGTNNLEPSSWHCSLGILPHPCPQPRENQILAWVMDLHQVDFTSPLCKLKCHLLAYNLRIAHYEEHKIRVSSWENWRKLLTRESV